MYFLLSLYVLSSIFQKWDNSNLEYIQWLAKKSVFCQHLKIWHSSESSQNWKMIDTSFERSESQLPDALSKLSKMSRLLSFRLNLICAKITQFSKLNNFETAENFAAKTHWETPHISTNKWWQNESFSTMFRWFFSIVNIAIL